MAVLKDLRYTGCGFLAGKLLYLCAFVTKQYNLVPAGKVTVALVESNGSPIPDL